MGEGETSGIDIIPGGGKAYRCISYRPFFRTSDGSFPAPLTWSPRALAHLGRRASLGKVKFSVTYTLTGYWVGAEVAYLSFAGFNPDDLHVCSKKTQP
jgi:hypothetical protein